MNVFRKLQHGYLHMSELKLCGLVNKKNKIPKIQLYIAYFALLNKSPKYEEHSDFFK